MILLSSRLAAENNGELNMPGIKDVAERAGLSIATVSRALSGKGNVSARSRERAQAAAAELGFVLSYHASSLASGRNHNVGVFVPSVHRWFFSRHRLWWACQPCLKDCTGRR